MLIQSLKKKPLVKPQTYVTTKIKHIHTNKKCLKTVHSIKHRILWSRTATKTHAQTNGKPPKQNIPKLAAC